MTVVTFFLIHLIPGDPAAAMLGDHYSPAAANHLRHILGLNKPVWEQYLLYMERLVHGDLGNSIYYGQPVLSLVRDRVAPTVWLIAYSGALSIVISAPLGVLSALRRDTVVDQVIRGTFVLTLALPAFWVGIMLILFLSIRFSIFPVTGFGDTFLSHLWHLFLPAFTIALGFSNVLVRSLRDSILSVLAKDYVRTARAKGLSRPQIIIHHVLRNAILPTVTILGVNIAFLIGGTVVVENVFALGGIGQLLVSSILQRDYPVVQGLTLVLALSVVLTNVLTDIVYLFLDPRITYG